MQSDSSKSKSSELVFQSNKLHYNKPVLVSFGAVASITQSGGSFIGNDGSAHSIGCPVGGDMSMCKLD